ncbi:MAG: hypothetical protein ISS79_12760 [Phycisphaerae bacterium]|nr:hypothetical protein [Phycisphaerae bacterium]
MKRWAILTVVLAIISVSLVSSHAGININPYVPRPGTVGSGARSPYGGRDQAPGPYGQTNSASGARPGYPGAMSTGPAPLDPNKVVAAVRAFPGLEQQLTQVGRGSRAEVTEWLRPISATTDNRSRLAREVQKQVAIELAFLRKIANEEGAKKTAAAIDGILLVRESRLTKLTERMNEEKRSARTGASATRSSRTRRGSSGSGVGTESKGRYSPSNRDRGETSEGAVNGQGEAVQEEPTSTSGRRRR